MEPWILILIVVVVVIAIVVMVRSKTSIALPPEEPTSPKAIAKGEAKAALPDAKAKEPAAKDAPKAAADAKEAQKAEPSKLAPAEAEALGHAETIAPDPTQLPAPAPLVSPASVTAEVPGRISTPAEDVAAAKKIADEKKAVEEEQAALRKGLGATRTGFFARLKDLFVRKPALDPAALDEVEEILLSSDVGVQTTQTMLKLLREKHEQGSLADSDALQGALKAEARRILGNGAGAIALPNKPTVLLFVGVNGVGKTTTIGKLASKFKDDGKKVLLAAGDTYRAAAVIQLEAWGRRVGCDVVKGKERSDPSGVIFDAVKKGVDEGYDVVLCDTAGRLQTKTPLMDELAKMGRSVEKALGRNADETLLVLDATTGQNAIQQATTFGTTLALSGIVLTKLDGTAKGGVILGIVDEQKVPVRYIGIGERVEDLRVFDPASFVDALFEPNDDAPATAEA
jgi:fused signal recognition particle receptor